MTQPVVIDANVPVEGLMPLDKLTEQQQSLAVIETADDAQRAGQYLREVRTAIRAIKAKYQKIRKPVNDALKNLKKQEEDDLEPFEAAELMVNAPLIAWQVADRQRVEATRRAALEEARKSEAAKRETQVAELKAAAQQSKGIERAMFKAQAKAVEVAPITTRIDVETVAAITKIAGVTLVESKSAQVDDLALLVAAVAQGRVSVQAIQPNQKWLDAQADSLGNELCIPGVSVVTGYGQKARGV